MTHIENCSACGGAMDVSAQPPFSEVVCPECEEKVRVKQLIGDYKILSQHGVGGMSLVFAAEDQTLGRKVAIKLLNEDFSSDPKRIEAFEKEAKITAAISHPNVVSVYTVGQAFDRYFIAMELVEGDSLEQRMHKEGALDEKMVTRLALEIVEGLMAAQHAGLIHRDMKPGNVLLDSKGHAKIVDFGLALMTQDGKAIAEDIWATPYYVPPEALELKEEDLRSDVYALGASLYHALSGEVPFETKTRSTSELLKLKADLPKLGEIAESVSGYLCEVIDRMMAYSPDDRFQSYEELLEALKQVEVFHRTGMKPVTETDNKGSRKALITAAVAACVLLIGGGVWYVLQPKDVPLEAEPEAPVVVKAVEGVTDKEKATRERVTLTLKSAEDWFGQRKYKIAQHEYLQLALDPEVASETAHWAGLNAAITGWLAGDPASARAAIEEVLAKQAGEGGYSAIVQRLRSAMQSLQQLELVSVSKDAASPESIETMILFATALKEWEQGRWLDAEKLFCALQEVQSGADPQALKFYKELSAEYLADFKVLKPFSEGVQPESLQQAKDALLDVEEARKELKTQGRAVWNVAAWKNQLEIIISAKEKEILAAVAAKKLQEQKELEQWNADKESAREAFEEHKYQQVVELLATDKSRTEIEKAWCEKLIYFSKNTLALFSTTHEYLKGKSAHFFVRRRDGRAEYEKILGASRDGLLVEDKHGKEVLLIWTDIAPRSMLEIHTRIKTSHLSVEQKLQRKEQLVNYLWVFDLKDKATAASKKLAAEDPAFGKRWETYSVEEPKGEQ